MFLYTYRRDTTAHTFTKSLAHLITIFISITQAVGQTDWTRYVKPFLGTEGTRPGTAFNGGNIFPGAVLPFGSVKLGPDTTCFTWFTEANAGYTPDGNVTGFSLTHVSGTGGGPVYGVVSQMPLPSLDHVNVLDNFTYMAQRRGDDEASVGYYKSTFQNGIVTELSATRNVGMLQYSFPSNGHILVDVSHYLPTTEGGYQSQFYGNGKISVSENGKNYQGYGIYKGAFSEIPAYQVYFCGEFDSVPSKKQIFSGIYTDPYNPSQLNAQPEFSDMSSVSGGPINYLFGRRVGAVFSFDTVNVKSKVGISWISEEKACQFKEEEMPGWELKDVVTNAKNVWNDEVLSKITTTDLSNQTQLEMFYTGLYHTALMPTDKTGQNPHWETDEPVYDDYYTFWDTFRCLNSLMLLIMPDRAAGIIRSTIDIWRHERFMPDGRSGFYNGQVQGGSNADNVLADAYVKGLDGGINWDDAFAAMQTDAELTPYNTNDAGDPTSSVKEGRGALPDWLQFGWITPRFSRSVSRTVEYSLNDFSVAQVAKGIQPASYDKYLKRSAGWQRIWQHDLYSLNYTGFLAPLFADGARDPKYTPAGCDSACEAISYTYEALPWAEYSWTVPHDMQTLISFMGGENMTESRLDAMFIPGGRQSGVGVGGNNGVGDTLYNPGNEPSFSTPLLYNYLPGRQYKSVLRSRQVVNTYYSAGKSGLPGNSDSGAIDSWMMWQMIGLYPVVTQPVYLITSPWFTNINMTVGSGKFLLITTKNSSQSRAATPSHDRRASYSPQSDSSTFQAQTASKDNSTTPAGAFDIPANGEPLPANWYVQSLLVNGVSWNRSWLSHDDIKNGGTLEFELGPLPKKWDTGEVPPSPGHVVL
ncbi:alpha-1,2-mannosidase [Blumeria hordei DH14]|uniref:Alpha-1,2-mannosidase n=1 Tax=Blumeria graminis f. sp. hordei (strain DH14) TaxID=546991 RepID=N1JF10_BLUG1|nr:alpha-1,2-mannosidase [Blumeria hordei DH14]